MEDIPVNSQTLEPTAPCALCGEALTSYHAFGEQVWHHKEGFYAPHKDTDCFLAQTAIKRGLKAMKWNTVMSALTAAQARIAELEGKLNTPELHDFSAAVVLEAAHQRNRWGASHDIGKEPQDWFWLLGYLGGKALRAALDDNQEKALHHCISTAAACANWHAAISGSNTEMRPGVDPAARGIAIDTAAREIIDEE